MLYVRPDTPRRVSPIEKGSDCVCGSDDMVRRQVDRRGLNWKRTTPDANLGFCWTRRQGNETGLQRADAALSYSNMAEIFSGTNVWTVQVEFELMHRLLSADGDMALGPERQVC